MQIQNANVLIDQADQLLSSTIYKLEIPEVCITKFLDCYTSSQLDKSHLTSFLTKSNIELHNHNSIKRLIVKYKSGGYRFQMIVVSHTCFSRNASAEPYSMCINAGKKCVDVAKISVKISTNDLASYKYYLSLKQNDNEGNKNFN